MLPAMSSGISSYITVSTATLECHVTGTGHDIPNHHRIPTQGQPVVVLPINMMHHNYQI